MSYNPQSASHLLHVPIEIRRAIFADLIKTVGIHITLSSQEGFRLTRCFDPDLGAEHVGNERRPGGYSDPDDRIWAHRLASTWGPHWQCEESALVRDKEQPGSAISQKSNSFMPVCKRLYYEICDFMKELVRFHVTDLDTVNSLFQHFAASQASSSVQIFPELLRSPIRELHITFSLPLPFFEYFDDQPSAPGREQAPLYREKAEIWAAIPQGIIAHLPSLRKLSIWLDHPQKPYWAVVHERALLRPFQQLANLSHLDLSFDLPKLKPRVGGPTRLFLEEDGGGCHFQPSSTPIQIRRRLRQRRRTAGLDIEKPEVVWYYDFPLGLGFIVNDGRTVTEIETRERWMEDHGLDVQQDLAMSCCTNMSIPAMPTLIFGRRGPLTDHAHLVLRQ